MAINPVQRALTLMSVLKGPTAALGTATTVQNLMNDVPPTLADDWGEYFYTIGPKLVDENGDDRAWDDLSNAEKGTYYLNRLRAHHKEVRRAAQVPPAVETTRDTETQSSDTAAENDLGAPE